MLVKDVMTKEVKTIEKGSTLKEAGDLLTDLHIGCVIVIDPNQRVVGIVTESDLIKNLVSGKPLTTKVDECMTKKVYFVKPEDDIYDAVKLMTEKKIKKLPVIKDGQLLGIITATDIAAAEPKHLEQLGELMLHSQRQKFIAG